MCKTFTRKGQILSILISYVWQPLSKRDHALPRHDSTRRSPNCFFCTFAASIKNEKSLPESTYEDFNAYIKTVNHGSGSGAPIILAVSPELKHCNPCDNNFRVSLGEKYAQ